MRTPVDNPEHYNPGESRRDIWLACLVYGVAGILAGGCVMYIWCTGGMGGG